MLIFLYFLIFRIMSCYPNLQRWPVSVFCSYERILTSSMCFTNSVINVDAQTVSSAFSRSLFSPLTWLSGLCWLLHFQIWWGILGYSLFQINITFWIKPLFYFVLCLGKFASLGLTRSTCFPPGCGLSVSHQVFLRAALRRAAGWSLSCSKQVTRSPSSRAK